MIYSLALLLQSIPGAAVAPPPPPPPLHGGPQEMACPVGGERFATWRPSMYSTYGARPDGKPYSYLPFPFPVPECPGNKLIAFDAFSASETAILAQLIATAVYRRLVAAETTYYRAYWLATKLGRPKAQPLELLLSAIWQVSPGEMSGPTAVESGRQFRRYQETFIKEVGRLDSSVPAGDRLWLGARAANAARQLGHFNMAEQLREQAESLLPALPGNKGWRDYLAKLKIVIDRRDDNVEPLDMIPQQQVAYVCARQRSSNAFDRTKCAMPEVAARVTALRNMQP